MDNSDELYTVGQISKLCNIPIKTLRYYDGIGLLLPECVDRQNNYRYYSKRQVVSLNTIKHFRASGFSLEDIRVLLKREDLTLLIKKLEEKLQHTARKIEELEYIQEKLEIDIDCLKQGKEFYEHPENGHDMWDKKGIEAKDISVSSVLYTRYRCASNIGSYIKRFTELAVLMEKYNLYRIGPMMAIFHDYYTEFDYNNADIEVCVPVAGDLYKCPNIRPFGGFLAVTMLHKGRYDRMPESYGAALKWIEKRGYRYIGPAAEKYIIDISSTGIEDNYVTEIILPVKKG